MSSAWQEQYWAINKKILHRLESSVSQVESDFTYASGLPGQMMAMVCLAEHDENYQLDRDLIEDGLCRMLSALPKLGLGLFQGSTGLMFCALEIERHLDFGLVEDAAYDYDVFVLDCLKHEQNLPHHFDLISGISGLTVYAVYRAQQTGSKELLQACIARLEKMSTKNEVGTHWFTPPDWIRGFPMGEMNPLGCIDLGLAHGQPGVLAALAYAIASGQDTRASTIAMLKDGLRTLRHYDLNHELGHFASAAGHGGSSRCAWCYGDFGAASALRLSAQALREPGLDEWANRILAHMSRREVETLGFVDAWMCHGSAGSAWIMRQLSREHDNAAFEYERLHLIDGMCSIEYSLAHDNDLGLGILEGCAGAALTFAERLGKVNVLHWSLPFLAGRSALRDLSLVPESLVVA